MPRLGLHDDRLLGSERWSPEAFGPLLQSRRQHSALRTGARICDEPATGVDTGAQARQPNGARQAPAA